jgi:serine/threonine protein kinase
VSPQPSLPRTIGKYEVIEMIGRGGMGVVYKARDPNIDRVVAIKTIRLDGESDSEDNHLGRLRMEARSAGKLHHPNIVTIFDFGEENGVSFIVMEYVQGVNLSRVMQQHRPLPLVTRLDVLIQVARGLAYAHENGVVHRDMKPSNVCVTVRGVAKILDFGLARFDDTRLTKTGYLSGTMAYMSPQRFRGDTGPADDIFALGAVAYELLTYQRAFPGDTTPEVVNRIVGGELPPPVSTVTRYPQALDDIIMRAMQPNPGDRYQTAADFERALVEFKDSAILRRFAADEAASPEFQSAVRWTDSGSRSALNPYSSSARSFATVASDDAPTVHAQKNGEPPATELLAKPAETDPTLLTTRPVAVPTEISALQPARSSRRRLVAFAVLTLAIVSLFILSRTTESPAPAPVSVARPVPPREDHAASRDSEIQLATASTLSNLIAQRPLSPDERARFAEANSRLDLAKQKIESKDYAAAAALASQASTTFRELLANTTQAKVAVAAPPPKPRRETPRRIVAPAPVTPQPQPQPVVVQRPEPVPPPVVTTTTARPEPSRADLEREIRSFVGEMATAYEQKDVSFFRQRAMNFTDQMGRAISNSPSVRVAMTITSIRFTDEDAAQVSVRRVDTFAEAGTPPGVANLVFDLRRSAGGWRIASVSRQ